LLFYQEFRKKQQLEKDLKKNLQAFPESNQEREVTTRSLEELIAQIEVVKQKDDFDGTTSIYLNNIGGEGFDYLPMYFETIGKYTSPYYIGLAIRIFEGTAYLSIYGNMDEMAVAKGDQMILLFEKEGRIEFTFQGKRSNGANKFNIHPLSEEELRLLATQNLDKWKLISSRRNTYVLGNNTLFHECFNIQSKEVWQKVFRFMAFSMVKEYLKNDTTIS